MQVSTPTPTTTPLPLVTVMVEDLPPPKADFSAPPPYEVAAKLPTYEEVQREKIRLGEPNNPEYNVSFACGCEKKFYENKFQIQMPPPPLPRPAPQSLAFLAIDADSHDPDNESGLLGTDFMFFTAFLGKFTSLLQIIREQGIKKSMVGCWRSVLRTHEIRYKCHLRRITFRHRRDWRDVPRNYTPMVKIVPWPYDGRTYWPQRSESHFAVRHTP